MVTSAPQIAYFTAGLDVLKRIASAEVLEEASAQVMWAYANKAQVALETVVMKIVGVMCVCLAKKHVSVLCSFLVNCSVRLLLVT